MNIYVDTPILEIIWKIFLAWVWILPPILLFPLCKSAWLFWRREHWEERQKFILLEITPPPIVEKPFKAMEQVMSNFWGIYSSLNMVKILSKWVKGRKMYHLCFEIACIENRIKMYVMMRRAHRDTVESAIYSQFPEAEIREVPDYIENIPFDVPNKDWDMYGFDEVPIKPDVFPIKTYSNFFEERADVNSEEKRIDPIGTLFEGLAKLKVNEQIWLQFRIEPITPGDNDYMKRGKKMIDKLSFRSQKKSKKDMDNSFLPPEMKLTAREKEIVKAIEDKISKQMFKTSIRCLYFGERSVYERGRRTLAEQYFTGFSSVDLNGVKKWKKTKTRIYNFFIHRREFMRKRNIFRRYVMREIPLYPKDEGTFVMNTEELTTMFHFPISTKYYSALASQASKKGEAPMELPIELL